MADGPRLASKGPAPEYRGDMGAGDINLMPIGTKDVSTSASMAGKESISNVVGVSVGGAAAGYGPNGVRMMGL